MDHLRKAVMTLTSAPDHLDIVTWCIYMEATPVASLASLWLLQWLTSVLCSVLGFKCPAPLVSDLLCYNFLKKGASHSKRRHQTIIESLCIQVWLSSFLTWCIFAATSGGKELSFGYLFLLIGIPIFYDTLHPFGSDTQPNDYHKANWTDNFGRR